MNCVLIESIIFKESRRYAFCPLGRAWYFDFKAENTSHAIANYQYVKNLDTCNTYFTLIILSNNQLLTNKI